MSSEVERPAPPALPAPQQDVHLFDRLSVLYKYRWASLAVFIAAVSWVMVDSYSQIPTYSAFARVVVEDPASDLALSSEIASRANPTGDPEIYMQTQLRIIRGRDLAQRVATKLNLSRVPEFNGQGPQPTQLAVTIARIKSYAAWPYRLITGAPSTPSPSTMVRTAADEASYPDQLIGRLGVEPIRGSQLVDITFSSADPEFAARAANMFADEYVDENLRLKVQSLEKSAEYLTGEVQRQEKLMQQSELALAQYQERTGVESIGGGIVASRLSQFNESLTNARTERIRKENIWKQVQAAGSNVESVSSVINSPSVQQLRTQLQQAQQEYNKVAEEYLEKHPRRQQATTALETARQNLNAEIAKTAQNAKNEFDNAVAQEQSLLTTLADAKRDANELGRKGVDYASLLRQAESNRKVYDDLLMREKELRVTANSRTNNVRVVDRAQVPGGPSTPDHRRDWMFALAVGLGLALGIAFAIDYIDDTIKTPDDVTRRLKLKVIGLIPVVPGERHPLISGSVTHNFGEAYRSVRTALAGQLPGKGPHIIAVASSQPLEGKTTNAVNMALALAVGGARVLLIDADMRRPSVHKALRMDNERGLSQLLAGQSRMREVVQRTHDPNLLAITAGRTPANPSELLASDRMHALLSGLATGPFDWVIVDSPPVLAVTDAVILAPIVDAVVFVIGAEMTRWRLAERAVETLLASNPANVFAVLNKVNFGRNKYYYSRYYGHQYKNYYSESPAA